MRVGLPADTKKTAVLRIKFSLIWRFYHQSGDHIRDRSLFKLVSAVLLTNSHLCLLSSIYFIQHSDLFWKKHRALGLPFLPPPQINLSRWRLWCSSRAEQGAPEQVQSSRKFSLSWLVCSWLRLCYLSVKNNLTKKIFARIWITVLRKRACFIIATRSFNWAQIGLFTESFLTFWITPLIFPPN